MNLTIDKPSRGGKGDNGGFPLCSARLFKVQRKNSMNHRPWNG